MKLQSLSTQDQSGLGKPDISAKEKSENGLTEPARRRLLRLSCLVLRFNPISPETRHNNLPLAQNVMVSTKEVVQVELEIGTNTFFNISR